MGTGGVWLIGLSDTGLEMYLGKKKERLTTKMNHGGNKEVNQSIPYKYSQSWPTCPCLQLLCGGIKEIMFFFNEQKGKKLTKSIFFR